MRKVPPELGDWVLRRTDQPGSREALSVRVSHRFTAGSARFDEDNLVSDAGLVPLVGLAEQTGLAEIIAGKVSITTPRIKSGSANPAPKLLTVPGRRRESHPPPPTDPDVNLSAHPARAVQLSGRVP